MTDFIIPLYSINYEKMKSCVKRYVQVLEKFSLKNCLHYFGLFVLQQSRLRTFCCNNGIKEPVFFLFSKKVKKKYLRTKTQRRQTIRAQSLSCQARWTCMRNITFFFLRPAIPLIDFSVPRYPLTVSSFVVRFCCLALMDLKQRNRSAQIIIHLSSQHNN